MVQLSCSKYTSTNTFFTHINIANSQDFKWEAVYFLISCTHTHTHTHTHTDTNTILSPASLNNLFKPCLRKSGAVTSEGWCVQRFDLQLIEKSIPFSFTSVTQGPLFPTGDSFFFYNNHWDDRYQVAIWAVQVEWRLLVLGPLVQNGLAVSTTHLNEEG
jgi:hypothetical protein